MASCSNEPDSKLSSDTHTRVNQPAVVLFPRPANNCPHIVGRSVRVSSSYLGMGYHRATRLHESSSGRGNNTIGDEGKCAATRPWLAANSRRTAEERQGGESSRHFLWDPYPPRWCRSRCLRPAGIETVRRRGGGEKSGRSRQPRSVAECHWIR